MIIIFLGIIYKKLKYLKTYITIFYSKKLNCIWKKTWRRFNGFWAKIGKRQIMVKTS